MSDHQKLRISGKTLYIGAYSIEFDSEREAKEYLMSILKETGALKSY